MDQGSEGVISSDFSSKVKRLPYISSALFTGFSFIYFEIMIRIVGNTLSDGNGILFSVLFGLSFGLIMSFPAALLPCVPAKVYTVIVNLAAGIIFITEAMVKNSFGTYMDLGSIITGMHGVMNSYGDNLTSSVKGNIINILLFIAPALLYAFLCGKNTKKLALKKRVIAASALVAASAIVYGAAVMSVNLCGEWEGYSSQFFFDSTTEQFGLCTAVRLSVSENIFHSSGFSDDENGFVPVQGSFSYSEQSGNSDNSYSNNSGYPSDPHENIILGYSDPYAADNSRTKKDENVTSVAEKSTEPTATFIIEKDTDNSVSTTASAIESDKSMTTATAISDQQQPHTETVPVYSEKITLGHSGKIINNDTDYGYNAINIDFDAFSAAYPSIAELNNYVSSLEPSEKNPYTGIFKGKNLILICAEAFSDLVIDEELTPTLYRMTHNGIYFSDYYQPTWGGSTSTGEYSFLMGLVPKDGVKSILETRNNNNYFTLGNQLQRLGYTSCAYHNGNYDFYDRNLTHQNLGYSNYYGFGNGLEKIIKKYSDDTTMLDATVDLYLDKQPFSLYYMTISGHSTYTADNVKTKKYLDRVLARYPGKYKATTNYYLCYQLELENALTVLIDKLETAGIADDTVICITADHYPYGLENSSTFGNDQDYVADLYGYKYSTPWEKDHSSWILWSGCLENDLSAYSCQIPEPTYSLDIVPTLSNLFGVNYDSRMLVGRDVFSDTEAIVVWNSYSWRTVQGSYNAGSRSFTPNYGYQYDKEYIDRINSIVKNKIYFSGQAVKTDYYGIIFGKDTDT